ncbi:hypothetical protein A2833_01005 [Candidatus Azambacteria bacterium RIFCSPHIGHO2_01_FULL_44_55]|uniref:Uncharacterized protein n=1 Tax=Candidatus Azambacteria bacterium RIFCSPLOWO2_02_FULL_44_14 TaxID=1797306 RepID=A0A1F5CAE1_9BACT|nr:MAG: hypothetical protein A3A18_00820 [Candidatus Azambacteria bacterium RIFCSPLOWO2_01_FULL_44_84]OGD33515.1 MAG: hypothetical protein A3C78_00815 [Candidatus Azambacteria bacterium RIFCSPHIGHO2_02_FULL_45_18]OGD39836.1 MAG: hypothetical protein A3I30_00295 [Candidatus Azambacteria bacterium RIFCSPLOWO2_02_FULL_44_14]OGD41797.1 MAG: hypothetical protein A2833_01005 [Candidatus Azambacteria bacterium RIFCSPHIGHO2_01_FULL_44_55]OGD50491.1 MAG: hypothetical protein A2608_01025 [Candidatus Azam
MDQAGGLLFFIVFAVLLFLFSRFLRRLTGLPKQTFCDYHKWKWDEKIHNFRCQNKNCGRIAGVDSPPGWQPPISP